MNSKFTLSLLAASLVLAGCGDNSERTGSETNSNFEAVIKESLAQPSKIDFVLNGKDAALPLPSFMLLDTTDATLNIPLSSGSSSGLDNPQVAMGEADGWSTIMPFSIDLKFEGTTKLKDDRIVPDPVNNPTVKVSPQLLSGVVVAEVVYNPTTGVMTHVNTLTVNSDYTVTTDDSLNNIKVVPLKAGLKPKTDYIFALTSAIKDSNDKSIGMSQSYAILKTKLTDQSGVLDKPQLITQQVESIIADSSSVTEDQIVYSSWFTTSSTATTQEAVKNAYVTSVHPVTPKALSTLWTGTANPNSIASTTIDGMLTFNMTDIAGVALETELSTDPNNFYRRVFDDPSQSTAVQDANFAGAKAAITSQLSGLNTTFNYKLKVFKGTVSLPHFLSRDLTDLNFSKTPMRSGMPSISILLNTLKSGSDADKAKLTSDLSGLSIDSTKLQTDQSEQLKLLGQSFTLSNGNQLDSPRILTKYSPFPQLRSVENLNYVLIMPELNGSFESNIPVMIYQHGITSRKESAYNFAANHALTALSQSNKPYAILAIDQPLHGERGLANGTIVTTPSNPTIFMNLKYLPVARDNIRQGSLDGLGLRFALSKLATNSNVVLKKLDTSKVSLLGHSIGGITAMGTSSVANKTVGVTLLDNMFTFGATTYANAGGGIAPFLLESGSFKYTIQHNVLLSLADYATYYSETCKPASTSGAACVPAYLTSISTDANKVKDVNSTLAGFMFAAQTVLAPVDPVNVSTLSTGSVLGIQSENDTTIPNTTKIPAAGTYPLLKHGLSLSTVSVDIAAGTADLRQASYYNASSSASHSSAVSIGGGVTAEMHKQIVSFSNSLGKQLVAGDTNMLDTTK